MLVSRYPTIPCNSDGDLLIVRYMTFFFHTLSSGIVQVAGFGFSFFCESSLRAPHAVQLKQCFRLIFAELPLVNFYEVSKFCPPFETLYRADGLLITLRVLG